MFDPLPVRLSPLIGRERELTDIAEALGKGRLLTLTGPAGTGKTRLALAAAAGPADPAGGPATERPACWVELAPVAESGLVGRIVATRTGVADIPGRDPADAIAEHIAAWPVLLVLDNCEHQAAAAADLTERLLAACPGLVVLATSREPLGVEGERTWPVPPLSLPEPRETSVTPPTAVELAGFDAIRLFEQRAQQVLPSFRVTDGNAAAVLHICQRLDGLPLAIELAAARLRVLSAAQLAERLDDIFPLLAGGARSAPARHQTLRAALDWSHDLLSADERAVFRRLAVFSGGCTLDAAERVSAGAGIDTGAVLDLLTRLTDKSLLRVEHGHGGTRYQLLTVIRDYARERLTEAGETTEATGAHLRYFADLAARTGARIRDGGDDLERDLDLLDAELPNLRAALESAHTCGDAVTMLRIAAPLDRYAYLRGRCQEVRQWMDAAADACPGKPAALRAQALVGSGRLALLECDYEPAARRLEEALSLCRELGDPGGTAAALQLLGSVAAEQGRYTRAVELHTESLTAAQAAGDRVAAARAHAALALASWLQRDLGTAQTAAGTALAMFREADDSEGEAWALINLAAVALFQADTERAVVLATEARTASEAVGFREGTAWSLEQLGLLAAARGEQAEAVTLLRHSLESHAALRGRWRMASVLEDLAAVALTQQNPARAARLLGAAEAIRAAIGTVIPPSERSQHIATVSGTRSALGERGFAAAHQHGLLATMADLRADLPRAGVRAADTGAMPKPVFNPPAASPAAVPGSPAAGRTLRIRTLGAAEVAFGDDALTTADWGYAKPRELLFLLVSSQPLTKEQIGVALWPELSGRRLGNALHTALRELRHVLGDPGWVVYADRRYRFDRARTHSCDVTAFEDVLAAARRAGRRQDALPELQHAIGLYRGDFLDGMAAGEWALARRDELRRAFESALVASGRLLLAGGKPEAAAAAFQRAVAHEPLNESAHRELMGCWERLGEPARAIRHYEQLRDMLREHVGASPAAETTALYRRLQAVRLSRFPSFPQRIPSRGRPASALSL